MLLPGGSGEDGEIILMILLAKIKSEKSSHHPMSFRYVLIKTQLACTSSAVGTPIDRSERRFFFFKTSLLRPTLAWSIII